MNEPRGLERAFQWNNWRDAAKKLDAAVAMLKDRSAMDSKLLGEFEAIRKRLSILETLTPLLKSVDNRLKLVETRVSAMEARERKSLSESVIYEGTEPEIKVTDARPTRKRPKG